MALTVNIEPVKIISQTGVKLTAYIINYDLQSQNCILYWYISDINDNNIYSGNYTVPQSVLENWGHDDFIIIQSLVNDKGFTII